MKFSIQPTGEMTVMGLFGKSEITARELLSEAPLPTRQKITEEWSVVLENCDIPNSAKAGVVTELLHLHLFAIDLAIFGVFQDKPEIREALRDELYLHANMHVPEIVDDIPARAQAYGQAWSNHSRPDKPASQSVARKFTEICGFPLDVIMEYGVTGLFVGLLTSVKTFFDDIQKFYRVVPQ